MNINDSRLAYMEAVHKHTTEGGEVSHAKERAALLAVMLHSFGNGQSFNIREMNSSVGLFGLSANIYEPNTAIAKKALRVRHFLVNMVELGIVSKLSRFDYMVNVSAAVEFQDYVKAHPNKDKNAEIFGALDTKYFLINNTKTTNETI